MKRKQLFCIYIGLITAVTVTFLAVPPPYYAPQTGSSFMLPTGEYEILFAASAGGEYGLFFYRPKGTWLYWPCFYGGGLFNYYTVKKGRWVTTEVDWLRVGVPRGVK